MEEKIETLCKWIGESDNIVFFGGAGVSTESGIPDFRSVDGLYHMKYTYPPEEILSHSFFMRRSKEFFDFYKDKMIYTKALPNITHKVLANLESNGKLKGIITQNIDGLHQMAGSKNVLELHGSVLRNYCMRCKRFYPLSAVTESEGVPHCSCGGMIKPDVVLYEESLDETILKKSKQLIENADVFIIGGTSLNVYPAAGLINYYTGRKMVIINKSPTVYDNSSDLLIQGSLGEVFSQISERVLSNK